MDPTLELDVYADKPWALSPVLSTMNQLSLEKKEKIEAPTAQGIFDAVDEDALSLLNLQGLGLHNDSVSERRKYFGVADNRKKVTFNKDVYAGMEFGSGLLGEYEPSEC